MNRLKRFGATSTALIALAALFVALVMLSNTALRGMRLDLTEDRLYTLSQGTRNILNDIEEPINLYFFFSDEVSQGVPSIRLLAQRVQELLEEYALASNGNLRLQMIDPQPFSEEEERASQFGLQSVAVGQGENLYFGLAGTNALDGVEVIPFFQPDKEAFLEYEISQLIYSLTNPDKRVIGLLSSLPIAGGSANPNLPPMLARQQQQLPPWLVYDQMGQFFEVQPLADNLTEIPAEVDVLMLVHPKNLPEQTLYAIDQYVLGGGKALVFVDPHAQIETDYADPQNPAARFEPKNSNLETLLANWGVTMDLGEVIGDRRLALQVGVRPGAPPVQHLAVMSFGPEQLASDDVVTGELRALNFAFSGYFTIADEAQARVTTLVATSPNAAPLEAQKVQFSSNPAELLADFRPNGQSYPVAVKIVGQATSAFPDGPPSVAESAAEEAGAGAEANAAAGDHRSEGQISVIAVADVDMLSDRMWVRVQNFLGRRIATSLANNADFVVNALDNLTGSQDLIAIRGQSVSTRPFTTVEALARDANARLLAKEQELQRQLQETQRNLADLQRLKDDQDSLILSAEQQAELNRFRAEELRVRRELRAVRRELDQDIEQLGTTLKAINIGLVPLLLSLIALGAVAVRNKQRQRGGRL